MQNAVAMVLLLISCTRLPLAEACSAAAQEFDVDYEELLRLMQ